ncbi:MAG: D-glycerate dehydrogenase [Synergistaceae bacterium]|nr:D-glycerate dehydrogenase [Synergistaceae bacterium]
MKKILFSAPIPVEAVKEYKKDFELTVPEKSLTYDEAVKIIADYDAYMTLANKGDKNLLDKAVKLKVIANFGVGYDNIDWKYATEKGIAVVNTPTQVSDATAEHTVALIVDTMRGVARFDREVRKGIWDAPLFPDRNTAISGSVLGIVGFGRIGKLVCKKAQGLGMSVIYYDMFRAKPEVEKEFGVVYKELDDVVKEADCITLHVPYVPENHHLFNAERIAKMKKTAYLVNCSRGPIVDEHALADALKNNVIKGAGLDVFESEPHPIPELLTLENVVLTPHAASGTMKARIGMLKEAVSGMAAVLNGEVPYNVVNPEVLKK